MAEIDRAALLAFLKHRANATSVARPAGLAIASVYDGLAQRIRDGQFDKAPPAPAAPPKIDRMAAFDKLIATRYPDTLPTPPRHRGTK